MYYKWRSYDIWFLKYKVQQTEIFDIVGHFLPFQPLENLENQNFNVVKKNPWDIIILHICITNDNHMMYGSWDMECNRHNFLSLWTGFCHFTLYGPKKSKVSKKNGKNTWRYYHFTNINDSHMMHGSSDMECNGQNFLSFWTIFCSFKGYLRYKTILYYEVALDV